ncbi:hypothetical protein ACN27E_23765 [Mycobacterium sp. WMMD1722]|uniref:hypothetical protein n=1 Tax=Mycobacterium sp. WMMD1722 TaxID=3404117 RepID=UPI003BF4C4FA
MRKHLCTTSALLSAATAFGAAILAPAPAAHAQSAVATIGQLEATGFAVRLTRVGSAPLSDCVVTDISTGGQRRLIPDDDDDVFGRDAVRRTATVALDCTR